MNRMNKILVYACAAALLPFLFLSGYSSPPDYLVEIPGDFKVVAVTGGLLPGTKVAKVEIDREGNCAYWQKSAGKKTGNQFVESGRFKLSEAAIRFIFKAVRENNFFSLKENYTAKDILDGNFAQLTVTSDKKSHTVRTQNIHVDRFDNIMFYINMALPTDKRVMYNELIR